MHSDADADKELGREFDRDLGREFVAERDDEMHDLSPGTFRFAAAILIGLGVLTLAMAW